MTPEQAADNAAEVLTTARQYELDPERVAAMAVIADGWTRLHTALKMGQTELVTVNMSGTIIREPAPGEPTEIASLPAEVRTLIHAVDQMCDGWAEAGEIQQHALWQAVHAANAAVWNH